jgi:hypothetical protein
MTVAPRGAIARRLGSLIDLSNEEIACLESLSTEGKTHERIAVLYNAILYSEGDRLERTNIARDGWVMDHARGRG